MAFPNVTLVFGQSSADVIAMQKFLISQGMSIPSGPTGYFGNETKAALTQWQTKQGITGAGIGENWGPQSTTKATAILSPTTTTTTPTSTPTPSTPAPTGTTTNSSWPLTTWQMSPSGGWITKPTLKIDGRQYVFDTPQEYANAMAPLGSSAQTFANQFTSAIPYWTSANTPKPTPAPTPTPTPDELSTPSFS